MLFLTATDLMSDQVTELWHSGKYLQWYSGLLRTQPKPDVHVYVIHHHGNREGRKERHASSSGILTWILMETLTQPFSDELHRHHLHKLQFNITCVTDTSPLWSAGSSPPLEPSSPNICPNNWRLFCLCIICLCCCCCCCFSNAAGT